MALRKARFNSGWMGKCDRTSKWNIYSLPQTTFLWYTDGYTENISLLPIQVTFFWVEGHQFQRHGRQSHMGDINDKWDYLANMFWQMKAGSNSLPNQLFHHSPWSLSYIGKVAAYLNIQELYAHTYGISTISVTTSQKRFGKWKLDQTVYLINFFTIHLGLFRLEAKW